MRRDRITAPARRTLSLLLCTTVCIAPAGCALRFSAVDPALALAARRAVYAQDELPRLEEFEEEPREHARRGTIGQAIIGELLAIFPGILIHGIGHYYAGDRETAGKLSRIGQFGYLATGLGAGLITAGVYAYDEDLRGLAYSLYGSGGAVGAFGVGYLLVAWGYDLIDTPRAVLSGGEPPPRSKFVDSLDFFD